MRLTEDIKTLRKALKAVGHFLKTRARTNEEIGLPRYQPLYDEIDRIDSALRATEEMLNEPNI